MQVLQQAAVARSRSAVCSHGFLNEFLVCLHQSGHQQDAQEYLITLLNKLIEEMQNVMRHSTGMYLTEIYMHLSHLAGLTGPAVGYWGL